MVDPGVGDVGEHLGLDVLVDGAAVGLAREPLGRVGLERDGLEQRERDVLLIAQLRVGLRLALRVRDDRRVGVVHRERLEQCLPLLGDSERRRRLHIVAILDAVVVAEPVESRWPRALSLGLLGVVELRPAFAGLEPPRSLVSDLQRSRSGRSTVIRWKPNRSLRKIFTRSPSSKAP